MLNLYRVLSALYMPVYFVLQVVVLFLQTIVRIIVCSLKNTRGIGGEKGNRIIGQLAHAYSSSVVQLFQLPL